ncbi:hypothetical protein TSUD_145170 [Trifolium subterraneum]|uniref:Uncharacterized protein n=1 Tax=Trifolium subterraneum TaxID=3900 RepID=A0A2Z6NNF3_TRISU|nr:hypothetical protein TSUD_145170 [Trifolium subterraneum]
MSVADTHSSRANIDNLRWRALTILVKLLTKRIANLVEELEVANEHLKISNNEVARLRKELESRSSEIHQLQGHLGVAQENVMKLESQLDSGRNKIRELEDTIAWNSSLLREINCILKL